MLTCNFCDKERTQVEFLFNQKHFYICGSCVEMFHEFLEEEKAKIKGEEKSECQQSK